ncbi:MAG: SDR family NAD(P)-dependent oxidoreductase, partial [Candidatus Acidiferrum sp.]
MLLNNKVALITGSGRGIGRAIAKLFAQEGAHVFLSARTEPELASAVNEIVSGNGKAAYLVADISRESDC